MGNEMTRSSTDVIRRVFIDEEFHCLEVGPWSDDIAFVELRTITGAQSAEWFGSVSVSMTPDAAEELGRALIASAADIRGTK